MATSTTSTLLPSVTVILDAVRAGLPGARILGRKGIVVINSSLPTTDRSAGDTINVPNVASLGRMNEYAENAEIDIDTLSSTGETATILRAGKGFASTDMARMLRGHIDPVATGRGMVLDSVGDYVERKALGALVALGVTIPTIVRDVHSATTPHYLDLDAYVYGRSAFGDETRGIVGMIMHSQVLNRCLLQKDADGKPLHPVLSRDDENGIIVFSDLGPCYASDLMPVEYAVASAGTTPPVLTLTAAPGGPKGLHDQIKVECTTLGAFGTAQIKISTDGGASYVATGVVVPVSGVVDRTADLGLVFTFAAGTFATNNVYTSRAKYTTLIAKVGACIFWHNNFGNMESQRDVRRSSETYVLELLAIVHAYSKMNMGTRPGVAIIKSN